MKKLENTDTTTDTAEAATEGTVPAEHPEGTAPADDTTDATTEGTEGGNNAEAARYRRKLRKAEGERDALAQRLETLQRQQADTLITATGVKPDAVYAVAELADLLTDDGGIDPEKVTAAIAAARDRFGITKPAKGTHVPGVGNQPSATLTVDTWREAFTPSRRR